MGRIPHRHTLPLRLLRPRRRYPHDLRHLPHQRPPPSRHRLLGHSRLTAHPWRDRIKRRWMGGRHTWAEGEHESCWAAGECGVHVGRCFRDGWEYLQQVLHSSGFESDVDGWWSSYWNVIIARRKEGKPLLEPLFGYLPFLIHSTILVIWLQAELRGGVSLVHDARLLPFLGYWGMRSVFSHTSFPC